MDTAQAEPDLRAYKYRLDPNADQIRALSQAAGAARVSCNMLIARNLDALKAGWATGRELITAGADAAEAPGKPVVAANSKSSGHRIDAGRSH